MKIGITYSAPLTGGSFRWELDIDSSETHGNYWVSSGQVNKADTDILLREVMCDSKALSVDVIEE